MSNSTPRRANFLRLGLAGVVVGGMLTLGLSAPAFASPPITTTVKLTSKTGVPLSGYEVFPVDVSDGNEIAFDDTPQADPVSGKPGYYSAPLVDGDTYTLAMYPGGAALNSASLQYLGGTAEIDGADTFTVSTTDNFVAASIATGGTITGKLTGPTNAALKGAEADEYRFDGTGWVYKGSTVSGSTGLYTFANAVPGTYRFEFFAPGGIYPPIWSGSVLTLNAATSTYVAVGAKVTVNQKFTVGTGAITGTAILDQFGNPTYYDNLLTPVALPVTAVSGGVATSVNLGAEVFGAKSSSKGVWSIRNLPAGNYVVQLRPYYWQESEAFLSPVMDSDLLSDATVYAVTGGHTIATGTTHFTIATDFGAAPSINIENSVGVVPVPGAFVTLRSTTNPNYFVSGTSQSNGGVQLLDADGDPIVLDNFDQDNNNTITPGEYTLTVIDPTGSHEPYQQDVQIGYGNQYIQANLPNVTTAPGFSSAPAIAETATAVGTEYTVAATNARSGHDGDALSYQWLRNGSPIFDATDASYTSVGSDLGSQLSVRVGAASFGFATVYAYASVGGATPTPTTVGSAPTNVTLPSVTPATGLFVGSTLQASSGSWMIDGNTVTGLHYSYSWNTPTGGTGSTYVVQPGDVGNTITVSVVATKVGHTSSAAATSTDSIVAGLHPAAVVTKSPVITKKTVGAVTTWSVSSGSWNTTSLAFEYAWYVGNTQVSAPGATNSKITSTFLSTAAAHPGLDPLIARVFAKRTGYSPAISAPVVAAKGTDPMSQVVSPTVHDVTSGTDVSGADVLHFGDHLTVSAPGTWVSSDDVAPSSYAYQWFRNGVAIKGATTPNYVIGTADMLHADDAIDVGITVAETAISPQYPTSTAPQTNVGLAKHIAFPTPAPVANLTGLIADGHTVGVSVGSFGTTGVTLKYQWYSCPDPNSDPGPCFNPTDTTGFSAIAGATKSTIVASHATQLYLYATVTATKPGYLPATVAANFSAVNESTQIVVNQAVGLSGLTAGAAHVGQKLTAIAPPTSISGVIHEYTWLALRCDPGCAEQDVAAGPTYVPTAADLLGGAGQIRVRDDISKAGYGATLAYSSLVDMGPGTIKLTTAPKLTVLTTEYDATPGVYVPSTLNGGSVSYQWYVDGTQTGSASNFGRDAAADAGKAIWVDLTYHVDGYAPDVITHLLAQRGTTTPGTVAITGGTKYGVPLGVSTATAFPDADGSTRTLSYQWYENGTAIKGATHSTYSPPSTYITKHITVKVTGSSTNYATLSVTSAPITLAIGTFAAAPEPAINHSGVLQPGTVLTAAPVQADYGTTGIAFKVTWQRSTNSGASYVPIAGATLPSYTLTAADAGTEIRAFVSATKTGYTPLGLPSAGYLINFSPTLATFTPPTVAATPKVGTALTVSTGVWNTPSLTYAYKWVVNGLPVLGVTTATWTPTADTVGDEVYALVTASRAGYQPVTESSQSFVILPADAPVATVAPVITKVTAAGTTYSVSPGTWNVDGLTYHYQWQVGGVDASGSGARSSTFTADGTTGHGQLTVIVTVSRIGYATAAPRVVTWATLL